MSIEDLRNLFMSEHHRQEDLETQALRIKEQYAIKELQYMKVERQKIKDEKTK